MTWKAHLESGPKVLLPSLRKSISALKFLGKRIPNSCRNTLVKGLVTSKLAYLICIWGGATENWQKKAQIVLNLAARWVTSLPKKTRIDDLMVAAGWLDVREMTLNSVGVLMWKIKHMNKPEQLSEKIVWDRVTGLTTVEEPRIQFTNQDFLLRGCNFWNTLPEYMRDNGSLPSFKKQLKLLLLERRQLEPN